MNDDEQFCELIFTYLLFCWLFDDSFVYAVGLSVIGRVAHVICV